MAVVTLACHAMGSRCELVLCGDDAGRLRAAGAEALADIQRLDAQLSIFRPTSELSGINARAAHEWVRVEPQLHALLVLCRDVASATDGAFDITVGPLLECWGFRGGGGSVPARWALAAASASVGMQHVALDPEACAVRFLRPGVTLDLGGIGKGYAIERAAETLRELGVSSALLHVGTSSVVALGAPPDQEAWPVAIRDPSGRSAHLAVVPLRDAGLSVSGPHGRRFRSRGRTYGHIMDPRTGRPARRAGLAAVTHPSPTLAEALSTALIVAGPALLPTLRERWPEARVVLAPDPEAPTTTCRRPRKDPTNVHPS